MKKVEIWIKKERRLLTQGLVSSQVEGASDAKPRAEGGNSAHTSEVTLQYLQERQGNGAGKLVFTTLLVCVLFLLVKLEQVQTSEFVG